MKKLFLLFLVIITLLLVGCIGSNPSPPTLKPNAITSGSCGVGNPCPTGFDCAILGLTGVRSPAICIKAPVSEQVDCPFGTSLLIAQSLPEQLSCDPLVISGGSQPPLGPPVSNSGVSDSSPQNQK